MNGGGGYSGGIAELCTNNTYTANGGVYNQIPTTLSQHCCGGSYFYNHRYDGRSDGDNSFGAPISIGGYIGGQGGLEINRTSYWCDSGGDGGIAGMGGEIYINNTSDTDKATVYAYNGNMITETNYDYSIPMNVYNSDGTQNTTATYPVLTNRITSQRFIQTPIFAQNGVLRKIYKDNAWWTEKPKNSYTFFYTLLKDTIADNVDIILEATKRTEVVNYVIREEQSCETSGYINPDSNDFYGVGSGAGYIELSNGHYHLCSKDENEELVSNN